MRTVVAASLVAGATAVTPVTKVVNLLKEMQEQMDVDQKRDEEIYSKVNCWCKKYGKEKGEAVAAAQDLINQKTDEIEKLNAAAGRVKAELAQATADLEAGEKEKSDLEARNKQKIADFNRDHKENLQSQASLKQAIIVLKKHHKGDALLNIKTVVRHAALKNKRLSQQDKKAVDSFLQSPYTSESGEIFGILQNMLDNFQADMADAQKEEDERLANHNELLASSNEKIALAQATIDAKEQETADNKKQAFDAKRLMSETKESLGEDQQFLLELEERCSTTDKEWANRQQTRVEEGKALAKAIEFLTSDEAHALFKNTFSFLQTSSSKARKSAAKVILESAEKYGNPKMAALAMKMKLDAFTRLKKKIDDMVDDLLVQKKAEHEKREKCRDDLNENESTTQDENQKNENLDAKIATLTEKIAALKEQEGVLNSEIESMETEKLQASQNRQAENNEFMKELQEQRGTQKLLKKTIEVLNGFYKKSQTSTALMSDQPKAPEGFKTYAKKDGGGVVAMIEEIIGDSRAEEKALLTSEADSQQNYEAFMTGTNKSLRSKRAQLATTIKTRAEREAQLEEATEQEANSNAQLEFLKNQKDNLLDECTYILKNHDLRQDQIQAEVESLREAKAILSGSNFGAFLQKA